METQREGVWYLQGCYGSTKIDCERYKFVRELDEHEKNADPICDRCVDILLDRGGLEKLEGQFP